MASPPIVVSAAWLQGALEAGQKDLVLLDTTWMPQLPDLEDTTGLALYEGKHIPGALHFDMDTGVTKTQLIPRNLPEPAVFQEYVRSLGIGADSHVVFYDRDDGAMMSSAAGPRSCFIFKLYGHDTVSVLDGGLLHWEAEGYATETGAPPTPKVGDFVANFHKEMIVEFDDMREIEAAGDTQIVDTRLPINFNGQEPEPCLFMQVVLTDAKFPLPQEDEIRKGHMAKALNIGFVDFFGEDKISFKSMEDLQKLFSEAGVDLTRPAVVSCYIGHTAAMCSLLASFCGQHNFRVYYGSWTEYGQRTV